jgi:glutamate/tyrosine decarboxylase-like PLP-dependent enzyme
MKTEETLDPESWHGMSDLGHRMIDDMMAFLETVRERPVWKPIPEEVKASFKKPLPKGPQNPEDVYREFLEEVLPYPMGNIHPRFWGWAIGCGTPLGMLAEMLAAGMNPNLGGADHIGNYVESQVVDWCKEMLGYPGEASGLLVSGSSMANFIGLTVARNTKAGYDIRQHGLQASRERMTFYSSIEVHESNQRAIELLGLGTDSFRLVPVNTDYQIDLSALKNLISRDRDDGYKPVSIIGTAGTINTGGMDDLNSLADICEGEGLWFHVDGAFGALAALSPELSSLINGIERADSIALDLHKWLYMPFEIGCVLLRSKEDHHRTFSLTPKYITHEERGISGGSLWYVDYGLQFSRGFRALKAWMSIKEHGVEKYGRLIQQNVDQARYLADLITASPDLELLAPVSLNIVCFRFSVSHLDDESLNSLNQELLIQLYEKGIAVPSYTTLGEKYAIRVCITNHRSRREDFDLLVREMTRIGKSLVTNGK